MISQVLKMYVVCHASQVLKLRVRLPRHLQQGIKDVSCDTSVVESLSLDLQHNEYHVMKITSQAFLP